MHTLSWGLFVSNSVPQISTKCIPTTAPPQSRVDPRCAINLEGSILADACDLCEGTKPPKVQAQRVKIAAGLRTKKKRQEDIRVTRRLGDWRWVRSSAVLPRPRISCLLYRYMLPGIYYIFPVHRRHCYISTGGIVAPCIFTFHPICAEAGGCGRSIL